MADLQRLLFDTRAKVSDREVLATARLTASVKVFAGRELTDGILCEVEAAICAEADRLVADGVQHVVCTGVLHHLPDPDAGLRALHDVLDRSGARTAVHAEISICPAFCRPTSRPTTHAIVLLEQVDFRAGTEALKQIEQGRIAFVAIYSETERYSDLGDLTALVGLIKDASGNFSLGLLAISMGALGGAVVLWVLAHDRRMDQTPEMQERLS